MLLVVEDSPMVARAYARTLGRYQRTKTVHGAAEARAALAAARTITGLIVDVLLPDGSGLDLLAHAREAGHTMPALVISGHAGGKEVLDRCFRLKASFLQKPVKPGTLLAFAKEVARIAARGEDGPTREELLAVAEDWRVRYRLTPREHEFLVATLQGESREVFSARRGLAFNTVRKHATRLLAKTRHASLRVLVRAAYAQASRDALAAVICRPLDPSHPPLVT